MLVSVLLQHNLYNARFLPWIMQAGSGTKAFLKDLCHRTEKGHNEKGFALILRLANLDTPQ